MKPEAINLAAKLSQFSDQWSPKIVGQFNDNDIMVVKVQGEFVWHDHPDTDDFFLVLDGEVRIETEDGNVTLGPGELYVVPKGKSTVRSPIAKPTSCSLNRAARPTPAMRPPPSSKRRSRNHPGQPRMARYFSAWLASIAWSAISPVCGFSGTPVCRGITCTCR